MHITKFFNNSQVAELVDAVGRGVFKSTFMVSWKVSQLSRIGYSKLHLQVRILS